MRPDANSKLLDKSDVLSDPNSDSEDGWNCINRLRLINEINLQIPRQENMPYDEMIKKINWQIVDVENKSTDEKKAEFEKLLNSTRTFRMLSEVLKDMRKPLMSDLPKKPLSAFSIFIQDKTNDIKNILSQSGNNNVRGSFTRVASEAFKNLSKQEKEKYQKQAEELKMSYKERMSKIKYKLPKPRASSIKKPQRLLWEHLKQKNENVTLKEARNVYTNLSKNKKLKYILRYLGVENTSSLTLDQYQCALNSLTKEEIDIIDEYEGRPKKWSAYKFFLKEYIPKIRNQLSEPSKAFVVASQKWHSLSKEEKEPYETLAAESKAGYDEAYLNYVKDMAPDRQVFEISRVLKAKVKSKSANKSTDCTQTCSEEETCNESKSNKKKKLVNINYEKETQDNDDLFKTPKRKDNPSDIEASKSSKKNYQRKRISNVDVSQGANESMDSPNLSNILTSTCVKSENDSPMKKKKRKRDISESGSDFMSPKSGTSETRNAPLEPESNSKKKRNTVSFEASVSENDNSEEVLVSTAILKKRPGKSAYSFYKKEMYTGPPHKAEKSYNMLSNEEKKQIESKYRKAKKKYLKKVKHHLDSLTAEEVEHFKKLSKEMESSESE